MRVFCLGTGRCGTSTLYHAFKHAEGFTVGHESKAGTVNNTLVYPDNHIEVSSHLLINANALEEQYPDAYWVLLIRSRRECVESLAKHNREVMLSYVRQWYQVDLANDPQRAADTFYTDYNRNARAFLAGKPHTILYLDVCGAKTDKTWRYLWQNLQLTGDIDASLKEWSRHYNASSNRGRDNYRLSDTAKAVT